MFHFRERALFSSLSFYLAPVVRLSFAVRSSNAFVFSDRAFLEFFAQDSSRDFAISRVSLRASTTRKRLKRACWLLKVRRKGIAAASISRRRVRYAELINFTKRIGRALIRGLSERAVLAAAFIVRRLLSSALRGTAILKYIRAFTRA